MANVLVTGGAGYLGSTLVPLLLEKGHKVTVYDSLLHGGDALLPFFRNKDFTFVKGDVRDYASLKLACTGKDSVVHLAALVGLPVCNIDRHTSEQVNFGGSTSVFRAAEDRQVIYASTVSVYGEVLEGSCTEDTPTRPLSVYGSTKLQAEQLFIRYNKHSTAFRLPTIFGVSPRMRLDLMVNQLVYQAVKDGYAVIYEPDVRRTFIHVQDAAKAFLLALDKPQETSGQVYNVGQDDLNVTKRQLCGIISLQTGCQFFFAEVGSDGDKRNYEVSFNKIKKLGYEASTTLADGIAELSKAARVLSVNNHYSNI